jgi:hypothetical protein
MPKQKMRAEGKIFLTVVGLVIVVILAVVVITHTGAKDKFSARVPNFAVLPNNYVRVYLDVTNTGKATGDPSCTVTIQPVNSYGDPVGNGGFDSMAGTQSIKPGHSLFGHMDIVVSNNDAHLVTSKSMIRVSGC